MGCFGTLQDSRGDFSKPAGPVLTLSGLEKKSRATMREHLGLEILGPLISIYNNTEDSEDLGTLQFVPSGAVPDLGHAATVETAMSATC